MSNECKICKRNCPPPLVDGPGGRQTRHPEAFSRRHWTDKPLEEYRAENEARIADCESVMLQNKIERAKRSPQEQLNLLDKTLGKDKGAKRERARLTSLLG